MPRSLTQALVIVGVLAACAGGVSRFWRGTPANPNAPKAGTTWLDHQEQEPREAVRATPQDARAHLALISLLQNAGRRNDALDAAREAARIIPENEPIQLALASLLVSTARMEEAITFLQPLVRTSPIYRVRLASAQVRAGQRDTAVKTLGGLRAPSAGLALEAGQIYLDALRPDLALPCLSWPLTQLTTYSRGSTHT